MLNGFDDHLDNYGDPGMSNHDTSKFEEDTFTCKFTYELSPGDLVELEGDSVFDDDPDYYAEVGESPWHYEYGEIAEVNDIPSPKGDYAEVVLSDGTEGIVSKSKVWYVVDN